jgi:hypothetical protein
MIRRTSDVDPDETGGSEDLLERAAGEDPEVPHHDTAWPAVDATQAHFGEERLNP